MSNMEGYALRNLGIRPVDNPAEARRIMAAEQAEEMALCGV